MPPGISIAGWWSRDYRRPNVEDIHPFLRKARPMTRFQVLNWSMALPIFWISLSLIYSRYQSARATSAGLRTFPLVAVATCGLILLVKESFGALYRASSSLVSASSEGARFYGASRACMAPPQRQRMECRRDWGNRGIWTIRYCRRPQPGRFHNSPAAIPSEKAIGRGAKVER